MRSTAGHFGIAVHIKDRDDERTLMSNVLHVTESDCAFSYY